MRILVQAASLAGPGGPFTSLEATSLLLTEADIAANSMSMRATPSRRSHRHGDATRRASGAHKSSCRVLGRMIFRHKREIVGGGEGKRQGLGTQGPSA